MEHKEGSGGFGEKSKVFDISINLKLLQKCNEKDPDTFFCMFGCYAVSKGWSDNERTLLLQYIFTGKAPEALAALTSGQLWV